MTDISKLTLLQVDLKRGFRASFLLLLRKVDMYKLILFLLLICSCRSAKNQNSDQSTVTTIFKGTVILNNNGCPHYIEISNCSVSNLSYYIGKKVYPIELDDKFKKEGLSLNFNFTVSKAMSPTDCQVDYVVSLEDVSVTKK